MGIRELLDTQRRALLDLTYRNRLLNLPKRVSARSINIVDEVSAEVHRLLVVEKRSMSFLPARAAAVEDQEGSDAPVDPDEVHFEQPEDDEVDERGVATRHSDSKLQTRLTSEQLQKRLLAIHYDTQLIIDEQGVNVLFLTLGRLRYRDPRSRVEEHSAPLLMVPVTLERKSARERFHVRWNEEDPGLNLSLREKMRVDFGIRLPEFADEEPDITGFFQSVQAAVAAQDGWAVESDSIQLGFFSFSKLLMFLDLDPDRWPQDGRIDEHALIKKLMVSGFREEGRALPEAARLDEVAGPEDLIHIMDCDSSQALAIESVRRGANLVVQGPPGTGKSQTIANLVASLVHDGKRVLFVAEKMAALEVVKRRLAAAGLGPLCLELHSHKSNKRAVLEELGNTLKLGPPLEMQGEALVRHLREARDALNEHAQAMHRPLGQSSVTVFQVLGELAKRSGSSRPPFRLDNSPSWTKDEASERLRALQELRSAVSAVGDPAAHVWRGSHSPPLLRTQAEDVCHAAAEAGGKLQRARALGGQLSGRLGLPEAESFREIEEQCAIADQLAKAPKFDRRALSSEIWRAGVDLLRDALRHGEQLSEVLARREGQLTPTALGMDWSQARQVIAAKGRSIFRVLSGAYRGSIAQLRSVVTGRLEKGYEQRLALLDDLILGHEAKLAVNSLRAAARSALGSVWQDENTDWRLAASIIEWVDRNAQPDAKQDLREIAQRVDHPERLVALASQVRTALAAAGKATSDAVGRAKVDVPEAFGAEGLTVVPLAELGQRLDAWARGVDQLIAWVAYRDASDKAAELGLRHVEEAFGPSSGDWDALDEKFWHAFYLGHLDAASEAYPGLTRFSGRRHEEIVERFQRLDKERQQLACVEASLAHFQGMPKASSDFGTLGVLRGEIARKRGHMPIRKLLKHCGSAVQAIKPVFMMSPMSIAQFLEPGALDFDVLVIDEASQVEPVDALGAIARCKQMVVVGDDKQLPPTSFFSRLVEGEEVEDEVDAQVSDLESVLTLCSARGLPQRTLRWHYRSRHHSLIAVSNREFYDGGLFVVPSPDKDRDYFGLKFHLIEHGRFDRGNTGRNKEEAQAIARAVIDHAHRHPDLTLGVGAMSVRQRDAIRDELELLRREHPETEAFFHAHEHEPFFIKNLENIQGDERDVIMISVGYGRSVADDKMRQTFGPLNNDGGHRRLNVLISRAKLRCEVFSSIRADEIRVDESTRPGVAALKTFLHYAETGILDVASYTERGPDSPFEEAVQSVLTRQGLEVHNQVGVAGFFIDLAVVDPETPGRYLLGIECDGASYHASNSARDRDRLRQEILEAHGWTIHRIWSTDWFQREAQERERLLSAVASAKTRRPRRPVHERPAAVQRRASDRIPASPIVRRAESAAATEAHFPGVVPYRQASISLEPGIAAPHEVPVERMAEIVEQIIRVEGPIHIDELTTRVREAWGLKRVGSRIQSAVADALKLMSRKGRITHQSRCYMLPEQEVTVRDRSGAASRTLRSPELLPPAEIQQAIMLAVEHAHGMPEADVSVAVSRMLGFSATSQQLRGLIEEQMRELLLRNRLRKQDELVLLP